MKIVTIFLKYAYGDKARGFSLEHQGFYPALQQLGHTIVPFWFDDLQGDKALLRQKVREFIEQEKPDVAMFNLMRDEFDAATLDAVREKCVTLNWFGDDTWRFESFSRQYAPHFSFAITTDKYAHVKYQALGFKNVVLSQWAAYGGVPDFRLEAGQPYEFDVSFVGLMNGPRRWLTRALGREGIKVACFGHGWEAGAVSFERMEEIFRSSRINLNLSNSVSYDLRCLSSEPRALRQFLGTFVKKGRKIAEQIKARNFEIPACGGFQLSNYVPGIEDYFVPGQEIAFFTSLDDLIQQVGFYLKNEELRQQITRASHARTCREHLYAHRFRDIFHSIGARA